jgi:polyisoprenyl-phosphate glycosyltransferase
MTDRGLSYIIPAYNEEDGIVATVERLRSVLAGLAIPYEIIVVNDGSRDATRARAEALPGVRVISHPINTGYGSAIKTGIIASRYEWIGIVDADGTYDIEQLPRLVEKMGEGFDMAVAARANVLEHDRLLKRLFRSWLTAFLNLLISARIVDPNSGFRLFTKSMARTFFPFLCNTFSFTTSITIFALGEGYFVSYVPMEYGRRTGKSKVCFRDALRMAQLILQGITFFNPVKFYLMIGALWLVGCALPSMLMAAGGWQTAGLFYFFSGGIVTMVTGLGVLGDIIRISTITRVHKRQMSIDDA